MAYMNQTKKKAIEPKVKEILKKYGMKGRLGVRHHSTLVLNITEGKLDVIGNYADNIDTRRGESAEYCRKTNHMGVNTYHVDSQYTGKVREFLLELVEAMNEGNFNDSDIMTDYFSVGFYININVGQWDKPYVLVS